MLRQAAADQFPANERLVMRRSDGHEFVAELNGRLVRDGLGVPWSILVIIRDATERQRQEDELKRKNSELERFTYTVSHDLRSRGGTRRIPTDPCRERERIRRGRPSFPERSADSRPPTRGNAANSRAPAS